VPGGRTLRVALATLWAATLIVASCALDRGGGLEGDLSGGSSATGGGGGAGGTTTEDCVVVSDCADSDTECSTVTCEQGVCGVVYAPASTVCSDGGVQCDGSGQCVQCVGAQECAAGTCSGGVQTGGETCNDAGECVELSVPLPCDPYVCGAGVCLTTCITSTDCIPGYLCSAAGECVNDLPIGDACLSADDCFTGFCVDGVCCDGLCDGDCEACDTAATGAADGICSALPVFSSDPACAFACNANGGCESCGWTPTPPGGVCPMAVCSSCSGGTCIIACDSNNSCKNATLNCPAGWDCEVQCNGNNSCEDATINCPDEHDCLVECFSDNARCKNSVMNCGTNGTCHMECVSGNACDGADVICGLNDCSAACIASNKPAVACGSACSCDDGGC
jgi:hypothetical protein